MNTEALFSAIFRLNPFPTAITSLQDGKILDVNEQALKAFGYSYEEVINQTTAHLNIWQNSQEREELVKRLGQERQVHGFEATFRTKQGKLWTAVNSLEVIHLEGESCILWIMQDITERKAAQEALRRSEALFGSVFRLNPFPIAITRLSDGKILAANEKAIQAFGYSKEELYNSTTTDLKFWASAEERNVFVASLKRQPVIQIEKSYQSKSGAVWEAVTYIEMLEWEKEPCLLILIQDITERKKAEEAIRAYTQQLEELNTSKDKFFSVIAHDLLSPLNGILGSSQLLSQYIAELSERDIQELARAINHSTINLKRLLSNLLEWASIQKGSLAFQPKQVNLGQLISEVVELLQDNAHKKGICIEFYLTEDIYLEADEYMLQSILRNLLSNSIKFSSEGTCITLSAQRLPSYIQIQVKDQGVGMSKEIQDILFKIGTKHTSLGTVGEKGTGLGLMLCKEFVEKHGGNIWVESEAGKGTIFTFTLPNRSYHNI